MRAPLALLVIVTVACAPQPQPTPSPSPSASGASCQVSEGGTWQPAEGPHLESTRALIRAAQREVGDSCGLPYAETVTILVERLLAAGACAGQMGEDGAEIFIRVDDGPQAGLYEQWHPAHAGTGCIVTGPQKGLWERLP